MATAGTPCPALTLKPVFGLPLDLAGERRVAVFLLRATGLPQTRASLAALDAADAAFDHAGVLRVAVVADALDAARDFVPRHHLLTPLVCDPDGAVHEALGAQEGGALDLLRAPPGLARLLGRHGLGRRLGRPWRPAALLVEGGVVRWRQDAPHAFAQVDPAALLAALAP